MGIFLAYDLRCGPELLNLTSSVTGQASSATNMYNDGMGTIGYDKNLQPLFSVNWNLCVLTTLTLNICILLNI